ncbi:MAG: plasmid pRiA4b ORF-3 family protein [Candidatus Krumholzibacteria bacterium]|jgi:hypothetical protein|nr:plasmid pRiA4b ORF-3 family protein [Candidatus Krumholzibacteria bacterium]
MTGNNIIPFPGQPPCGSLVLHVELVLMPYPIWRRLRLSDRATFWDLHAAIQDAMGWSHRRRHLFTADHPVTGNRLHLGIPAPEAFYARQEVVASWEVKLVEVLRLDRPPFLYTHHLGEQWQHEVTLERIESAGAAGPVPVCLDGAGACPPEGCGGAEVFNRLLAGDRSELPPGFDPAAFAAAAVRFCDPGLLWQEYFRTR